MTESAPARPQDSCFRHPGRQSFILCQRCHRTICPDCAVEAPVGFHCVECVRDAQRQFKKTQPGFVTKTQRWFTLSDTPVTFLLIGFMTIIWLLQEAFPIITDLFLYAPMYTNFAMIDMYSNVHYEPWRMLTSAFLHGGFMHLAMNMLSIFLIGRALEQMFGRTRYLTLFVISGLGGSLAVQLLSAPNVAVVGASGAIYGMLGAYFLIAKQLTGRINPGLIFILGLNLFYGFTVPGISWEAHIGGLVTGALVAVIYLGLGRRRHKLGETGLLLLLTGAIIAVSLFLSMSASLPQ